MLNNKQRRSQRDADVVAAATIRIRERYGLAPHAGREHSRSTWVSCAGRRGRSAAAIGEVRWKCQAPRVGDAAATLSAGASVFANAADASTFQPRSNARRTVPEHNLPGGLAVAQEADGLTIREEQIRKVECDGVVLRQHVERLTQLVDILCVEPAADGQHRTRADGCALYLEHRPGCAGRNFRSNQKR